MTKVQVNSQGKAYMTANGKVLLSSGSSPVISSLNVTPTTSAQTITAPSGTDGYSPVNVSAVTSSIDSNITAANIKKDVVILGVTGSYEGSGGSAPVGALIKTVNNLGYLTAPSTSFTYQFPTGTTKIMEGTLYNAFYNSGLTSIDLSNITYIDQYGMINTFANSSLVGQIDFSSLTVVEQNGLNGAFANTGITSLDLSSLTTINSGSLMSICNGCSYLTSVNLSSLTTLNSYYMDDHLQEAFAGTSLTSLSFPSLEAPEWWEGGECAEFSGMLYNVTGCTVHFPSNFQGIIGSWSQVLDGFGGTNTTVLFDLSATD